LCHLSTVLFIFFLGFTAAIDFLGFLAPKSEGRASTAEGRGKPGPAFFGGRPVGNEGALSVEARG